MKITIANKKVVLSNLDPSFIYTFKNDTAFDNFVQRILTIQKQLKHRCPKCDSSNIKTFDSNNDICIKCKEIFSGS